MDYLFQDITAITMMEGEDPVRSVSVGVENGKICYVGERISEPRADRVIDGKGKVLLPAFINCHSHAPMTLLRGYAGDKPLQEWLFDWILPAERRFSEDAPRAGAMLAMAEMIASGTASFTDMYFGIDKIARAVESTGMKANLSNAVVASDESYDFYSDRSYAETAAIIKEYHGAAGGRIKAEAGIHGEYTSFGGAWEQAVDFALKNSLNMHVHLSETKFEHEDCKKRHSLTPTQILDRHHVFDAPTSAAHCVWVEECDMGILREKRVSVIHCPVSNLKLASGIAPVVKMMEKGINVALGTDGMASNNSLDLFEEMKLAGLLQKNLCRDASAMPALKALKMATSNGAAAQGRQNECGRIEVGLDADIAVLNFHTPRQTPAISPLSNIVYSCSGRDVFMTMCQGRILFEGGEFLTMDIEKVLADANRESKAIVGY
ncbi:MAG: amidohydrolase [Clostridiales bacterium]|jgi:5-methylthioadenosine/S-adenosylhomocysteine deaminase|nr:amidohydrolase [Clostridiales bacterium]